MTRRVVLPVAVALALLALAGCGDDDQADAGDPADPDGASTSVTSGDPTTEAGDDDPEPTGGLDLAAAFLDEATMSDIFVREDYSVSPAATSDLAGTEVPLACDETDSGVTASAGTSESWEMSAPTLEDGTQVVVRVTMSVYEVEPGDAAAVEEGWSAAVERCTTFGGSNDDTSAEFTVDPDESPELADLATNFPGGSERVQSLVAHDEQARITWIEVLVPVDDSHLAQLFILEGDPGSLGSFGGATYAPDVLGRYMEAIDDARTD